MLSLRDSSLLDVRARAKVQVRKRVPNEVRNWLIKNQTMTTSIKTITTIVLELSVSTKEVGTKENVIKTRDF